jgi:AraC-like DNA-binding protein
MDSQPFLRAYRPCPALENFVKGYIIVNVSCDEPTVRVQPAYAQEYLIFYPGNPQKYSLDGKRYTQLPQELLIGGFTQPVFLLQAKLQTMVLVNLFSGTLHRLVYLPMQEIANQPTDGINGFGSEIRKINEQLSDCKVPEQMVCLIENFLMKQLKKIKDALPIDHVFKLLAKSPNHYSIDQLASIACVSLRQFERQFLTRIGTTPTMYIRQARFGKAYRLKRVQPELSWTSIAYECGYFDQMHLIRDFKLFTSATPNSFRSFLPASAVVTT